MASPTGSPPPGEKSKARLTPRRLFRHRAKDSTSSVDMPERLKYGDDAGEEEITANSEGPTMYMDMNQSIFGLIAAAGSRMDFTDRFQPPSSDEEGDSEDSGAEEEHVARTTIFRRHGKSPKATDKGGHRRKLSDHKLLRSLPALPRFGKSKLRRDHRSKSPAGPSDEKSDINDDTEESVDAVDDKKLAPVMSRMLEARAEMAARPSFELDESSADIGLSADENEVSPLAMKLKEIFEFDEPEEVIEGMRFLAVPPATHAPSLYLLVLTLRPEYPCWLLQCVLLQGFMYITAKHVCFYAYLPKKGVSLPSACSFYFSNSRSRMRSPNLAISQRVAGGIPITTDIGSVSRATFSRTTRTPPMSTFPTARSTCATPYPLTLRTRTRMVSISTCPPTNVPIIYARIARLALKNGSRRYSGSFSGLTTTAIVLRSRFRFRTSSTLRIFTCWSLRILAKFVSWITTRHSFWTRCVTTEGWRLRSSKGTRC